MYTVLTEELPVLAIKLAIWRLVFYLQMAVAGFYHCPTKYEPDLAKCYVCLKELDGWEPTDNPWYEPTNYDEQ